MASDAVPFRLEDVSVRFGDVPALRDVSLEIPAGDVVAFVGPSGSGKTTLLRLLNGSTRPTRGRVLVGDADLGRLPPPALRRVRSRVGFVHQDLGLVPNLRVLPNVIAGRLGRRSFLQAIRSMVRPAQADVREAHAILERVGIEEKLFERTDRLSGGQRQRVAVARALFQHPRALLADEPVSSVDPARARDTVRLLVRIAREEGWTLAMSLHHLELAREHFARIVGLREGRVVFDARTEEIDDATFQSLYALDDREMLADHAGG